MRRGGIWKTSLVVFQKMAGQLVSRRNFTEFRSLFQALLLSDGTAVGKGASFQGLCGVEGFVVGYRLRSVHPAGDAVVEKPGVGVEPGLCQVPGGSLLHQPAPVHDADPVAEVGGHRQVVGDEEHTQVELLLKIQEKTQNLTLDRKRPGQKPPRRRSAVRDA